jgi:hypothetical protein
MKIFQCAAPLFFRWFGSINIGGALHLAPGIIKLSKSKGNFGLKPFLWKWVKKNLASFILDHFSFKKIMRHTIDNEDLSIVKVR